MKGQFAGIIILAKIDALWLKNRTANTWNGNSYAWNCYLDNGNCNNYCNNRDNKNKVRPFSEFVRYRSEVISELKQLFTINASAITRWRLNFDRSEL